MKRNLPVQLQEQNYPAFAAPATLPVQTSTAIKGNQQLNMEFHPIQKHYAGDLEPQIIRDHLFLGQTYLTWHL